MTLMPFNSKIKFDRIYVNILSVLQGKARISNLKLAEEISLSPSPCLERMKKLEKSGIIKRYIAEVDLNKTCPHVMVWALVELSSYPKDHRKIDRMVADTEEIVESYKVTGSYDYFLRFVCSDMASYCALTDEILSADMGFTKVTTVVVLQRNKEFTGYPLRSLIQV